MLKYIALFAIALMAVGCGSLQEEGDNILTGNELANKMAGEWTTFELYVEAKTWGNAEKDSTFTIIEPQFISSFGFAKNKGVYKLDGTFEEHFISDVDTLLSKVSGNWDAKDDTVYVQQMFPNISENHYHFELKGDTGYFTGYLDWDRDGRRDDYFVSKAIKSKQ